MDCDYEVINSNLEKIIGVICKSGRIDEYYYLIANRNLTRDPEYQTRYKSFW
jgi:hypothetical protein